MAQKLKAAKEIGEKEWDRLAKAALKEDKELLDMLAKV
jgi:hypothetical protein